ncbi:hypothetical protein PIB30_041700 [Stylosanthes scabra]|uniref:Uncharacterized protein n=1 Tax=Stylosanthes scabra TaxID=79078 RepID=A0ABU6VFR5_9FABA|nr:hypothetical protein [Stylosanthes scabra]
MKELIPASHLSAVHPLHRPTITGSLQNMRLQEKQNIVITYNCLRMDCMQP